MSPARCFPPIADVHARVLILGSLPGQASLRAGEYYAHPRNPFWRILGELTGTPAERPYAERAEAVRRAGIALWDVLAEGRRRGSLDADIERASERVNDFPGFLQAHPGIRHLFFNGAKAEASFRRHALPGMTTVPAMTRLPSTSPAHAGLPFEAKRAIWLASLTTALGREEPATR
jgi:hypoxanthine-DNA glycosylase